MQGLVADAARGVEDPQGEHPDRVEVLVGERRERIRLPQRGDQLRAGADELHAELARRGHPEVRPAHGFALQAIGPGGATAAETGRRLGNSKQAAGKTIDRLEELGYVHRSGDAADRRRKLVRLTPRGVEVLALSAMIFDDIRSRWAGTLGAAGLSGLEAGLRTMAPGETFRLDVPGWFGA